MLGAFSNSWLFLSMSISGKKSNIDQKLNLKFLSEMVKKLILALPKNSIYPTKLNAAEKCSLNNYTVLVIWAAPPIVASLKDSVLTTSLFFYL